MELDIGGMVSWVVDNLIVLLVIYIFAVGIGALVTNIWPTIPFEFSTGIVFICIALGQYSDYYDVMKVFEMGD